MTTELDSSTGTELAASLIDVSKSYKHFKLRNIHFSVQRGTVAGLIGPNGAGKSTTMRILMGLVQPDSGTVTALGTSRFRPAKLLRNRISDTFPMTCGSTSPNRLAGTS